MKKTILILVSILLGLGSLYATHIRGADLTYQIIDTNTGTYKFTLTLYRNCEGIQFGSQILKIRKSGYAGDLALTLVDSNIEITPICKVPDVSTAVSTNCPGPAAVGVNGIQGVTKSKYQATYTMGRNIGYCYVGWGACCRGYEMTCFPGNQMFWIQSVINTDFVNNSPVFTAGESPYYCRLREFNYNIGAVDIVDTKYITINGKSVLRDSFSYQLYVPFTGEATNPTQAANMQNPIVTLNAPLTAQNFLYTTFSGISIDKKTGQIKGVPSVMQEGVLAIVVHEWRAVPNVNGIGYSRQHLGYVCRDLQFTIRDICDGIVNGGISKDSSHSDTVIENTVFTSNLSNNSTYFKVRCVNLSNLKIKDLSKIDSSEIFNYQVIQNIVNTGTDSFLGVRVLFDRSPHAVDIHFLFQAYYCSGIGVKMSSLIPIRFRAIEPLGFSEDTVRLCTVSPSIRLYPNASRMISWSAPNYIVASAVDSSWVDVHPPSSMWFYVHYSGSTMYDSIYVKVDTCSSISSMVYLDINKNCAYDSPSDYLIKNHHVVLKNLSTNKSEHLFTDFTGQVQRTIEMNQNYEFEIYNELMCNTGSKKINFQTFNRDTNITLKIPLNPDYLNSTLNVNPSGRITNKGRPIVYLSESNNFGISHIIKSYTVEIPNKCSLDSCENGTVIKNGHLLNITSSSNYPTALHFYFDSLTDTDTLCFIVRLFRVNNEQDTSDNYIQVCSPAFASRDPNNKLALINSSEANGNFADKNNYIHYTINFQNTGNALAQDITVTDVLDSKLDMNTFQINRVSHSMQTSFDENRKLRFHFKNIMLPDSNSNEKESHGYIHYMIKPILNLNLEETIENEANIYFDFNPPILTNKTINKYILKSSGGVGGTGGGGGKDSILSIQTAVISDISIYPNPAKDFMHVSLPTPIEHFDIAILDINGRIIKKLSDQKRIDLTSCEKGIYILHLESDVINKQFKIQKE